MVKMIITLSTIKHLTELNKAINQTISLEVEAQPEEEVEVDIIKMRASKAMTKTLTVKV